MTNDDVNVTRQRFHRRPQHRYRVIIELGVNVTYEGHVIVVFVAVLRHVESDQFYRVVEVLLFHVHVLHVTEDVPFHHGTIAAAYRLIDSVNFTNFERIRNLFIYLFITAVGSTMQYNIHCTKSSINTDKTETKHNTQTKSTVQCTARPIRCSQVQNCANYTKITITVFLIFMSIMSMIMLY